MVIVTDGRYVDHLPDLIDPSEYADHPGGDLVRLQFTVTPQGVEVLGDAMRPEVIETILRMLGDDGDIQQMLCG